MKTKIFIGISICEFVICIGLFVALFINISADRATYDLWFTEKSTDDQYEITGKSVLRGDGFLAVMGPRTVVISAQNNAAQDGSINERKLFTTDIYDDGGSGSYNKMDK